MAKITYTTKVDNQTSELAAINKVTADDMNEIKTSVNALYDNHRGWARYDDTQYTSSSTYALTASTPFVLPNNAGSVINDNIESTVAFYNGTTQKVMSENVNDVYMVTIAFKAKISNANGYMDLYLEGGNGTPYDRVRTIITFPKGNDVEHVMTINFPYYADADVVANGLSVKGVASHSGEIYDVIYFIQCTQKHNI